jgi:hypothetical protein
MTVWQDLFDRISGDGFAVIDAALARSWFRRGVIDAAKSVGAAEGEGALASAWGFAFEAGALQALGFAKAVLSDPACRGRELEALKLIAEGLGHAAIVSTLRGEADGGRAGQGDTNGTVVAFRSREGRT